MAKPKLKVLNYPRTSIVPLELVQQYLAAKRTRDEAEEMLKGISEEIKSLMGSLEEVKVEGYKIVNATIERTGLDTKKIKEEMPFIYDQYGVTTTYKRFEVKAY